MRGVEKLEQAQVKSSRLPRILLHLNPRFSSSAQEASLIMKFSSIVAAVGLAGVATAQSAPYTDPKSGITFNAYVNPTNGYFFGISMPANASGGTDFIGTIGGKGTGYSGVSLGGRMVNKLLIVAWPNGEEIVSSFRKASYVFYFLSPVLVRSIPGQWNRSAHEL